MAVGFLLNCELVGFTPTLPNWPKSKKKLNVPAYLDEKTRLCLHWQVIVDDTPYPYKVSHYDTGMGMGEGFGEFDEAVRYMELMREILGIVEKVTDFDTAKELYREAHREARDSVLAD